MFYLTGRARLLKKYPHNACKTLYEKMKSLPEAEKYLNDGVTFEKPDKTDIRHTDNEMVRIAHEERIRMFDKILSVA